MTSGARVKVIRVVKLDSRANPDEPPLENANWHRSSVVAKSHHTRPPSNSSPWRARQDPSSLPIPPKD